MTHREFAMALWLGVIMAAVVFCVIAVVVGVLQLLGAV